MAADPQVAPTAADQGPVAVGTPAGAERVEDRVRGGAPGPAAWRRVVVYGFLAAVLGCGVVGVEAWPLSGFRLFSQVRTGTEVRWELVAVDETGTEAPADLAGMGRGFRQSWHLLAPLADAGPAEQDAACAGWFSAAPEAERFRAYSSTFVRRHPADPPVLRRRYLRFECDRP